jgi:hypothetical protein
MTDTPRTLSALLAILADNTSGDISAQDARDELVSHWAYDAQALPTSAHANDDEFNDGSIGGSWTDWDPGSVYATSEGSFGIDLLSSASSLAGGGIHRAVPVSSDWTLTTKVSLQRDNVANTFAGVFLAEDLGANPSTGDIVSLTTNYGGSGSRLEVDSWTAYNTFGSSLGSVSMGDGFPTSLYLRISKTSTTYRFMWSLDGMTWLVVYSTTSLGITPVKAGLAMFSDHGNTVRSEAFFRFWRQVDSAAYYAPLLGKTP